MPRDVGIASGLSGSVHWSGQVWEQLTTPVAYLNAPLLDPFGNGLFIAYDDWNCSNTIGTMYLFFTAGPDKDIGEWRLSALAGARNQMSYDSSNGLISSGDITRCRVLRGSSEARSQYGCL